MGANAQEPQRTRVGVLAAIVYPIWVLAGFLVVVGVANADGAIALGLGGDIARDGVVLGASANLPTRQLALTLALAYCREFTDAPAGATRCKIVRIFTNQCYAVMFDPKAGTPGFGWGIGADVGAAVKKATGLCRSSAGTSRRDFCELSEAGCDFKDWEKRIAAADELVQLAPNNARELGIRCLVRAAAARDLQLALVDCNEALQLDPDDYNVLGNRGLVYLRLGRFDEAIADYDASLKRAPKNSLALFGRGIAKQRLGQTVQSSVDIAAAKAIDSDIAEVFSSYGVK
jgi:tetratricopeptide (TPR) repeat protein